MNPKSIETGPMRKSKSVSGFAQRLSQASLLYLGFAAISLSSQAQQHALRAGAAKADITPATPAGMQGPTGKYENEHIYARAIVLDNGSARAALIGLDQSNVPEETWKDASTRIAKELDCPIANIIMSATHTHSPGEADITATVPAGATLNPSEQRVADGMVNAVHQAKAKLQPAEIVFGKGEIDLNSNRDAIDPVTHLWTQAPNTSAPSDKTVAVVAFETLEGIPIGVYANYPMHAINGYLTNFTSGDFPGAMSRWVEGAYGDKAVAIFTQGASGDQNPLYLRPSTNGMASRTGVTITGNEMVRENVEEPLRDGKVKPQPITDEARDRLQQWMQAEGLVLGEVVIRAIAHGTKPERDVRIEGKQEEISCPGRVRTDPGAHVSSGPTPYVIGVPGTYADGPAIQIRIGVLGIGDVALATVNAEIYTLIGQRIKKQSPMANTMVVTIANGRAPSGYIPDDTSFSHNTFQVLASHLKVGCAESSIADGLTDLISQYESKK